MRELSCGYRYDLVQLSDGTWAQTNIRGNHIALVSDGRAGTSKIMDSIEKDGDDVDNAKLDRLCGLLEKLLKMSGAGSEEGEDDFPGQSTGEAIAEGRPGEALGNIVAGVSEVASGVSGAAVDDDPEAEYERTGGPQRKLKGFTGLIPTAGSGKGGFVNPVAARDALLNLRKLRPFIEANGDRKAKDAYNDAIKAIRVQIAAADSYEPLHPRDLRSRRQSEAESFEASAARYHGKAIKVHGEAPTDERRGEDAREQEETFDQAVERVRREQQARYMPKRRR